VREDGRVKDEKEMNCPKSIGFVRGAAMIFGAAQVEHVLRREMDQRAAGGLQFADTFERGLRFE
jgi:hypothetical protein